MVAFEKLGVAAVLDALDRLLSLERKEEEAREQGLRTGRTLAAQEADGVLLRHLEIQEEGLAHGGMWRLRLEKSDGHALPHLDAGPGDPVGVGGPEVLAQPDRAGALRGVLSRVYANAVEILLDGRAQEDLPRQKLAVWPMGSPVTFERARNAVGRVRRAAKSREAELRDVLLGASTPELPGKAPTGLDLGKLNDTQQAAVLGALTAPDVFLIHGPPGTGKTTTAATLARLAMARGERVLLCAASNTGADELARAVVKQGGDCIRVGHPARVDEALHGLLLQERVKLHPRWEIAWNLLREAENLRNRSSSSRKNFREAREENNARREEWRAMVKDARTYLAQAEEDVLSKAGSIACTLAVAGGPQLGRERFDLLILDEASQATIPASLIPLGQVERVVLVGDHKQLPPTILSQTAARDGLGTTLFDLLQLRGAPGVMLTVQHRMHRDIMAFPSAASYGGALVAHPSVASRTMADALGHPVEEPLLQRPFTFLDTAGTGFEESQEEGSTSWRNLGEAGLVRLVVERFLAAGLTPEQVGVVVPYRAQVNLLEEQLDTLVRAGLEVDSVDAFQGREKEAIVVGLVRSNDRGEAGFVEDARRLNVAITRARSCLVVVGDSATVGLKGTGAALVEHAQHTGAYESAWTVPGMELLVP